MSETERSSAETEVPDLSAAAAAQLEPLSQLIEATFAELGQSLGEEMARMSTEGRRSIRDLADGVIEDLARIAAQRIIRDPLEDALGSSAQQAGSGVLRSLINRSLRNG